MEDSMIEYRGKVSLWVGITKSYEELENYIDMEYVESGEVIDSIFGTSYKFGYYDEDCIEIFFYDKPNDRIEELLKDFSYDDIIIPQFKSIAEKLNIKANSIILLYDYMYNGSLIEDKSNDHYFKYIGGAIYEAYEE